MKPTWWLTRFFILRLLGLVYLVAFVVFVNQGLALIGHDGLTPADAYVQQVTAHFGSRWKAFLALPSLFWLGVSDGLLLAVGWTGVALSLLVVCGFANAIVLALLWALYESICHVGQVWYGYGWENQLLETGFLAIFLCPLVDPRPFPRRPPPVAVIWLFRWLTVRIMLGAGLIKIRGDACWRDLTCLDFHYQTQPIPNPLSPLFHFLPAWVHQMGVGFNHVCELLAPPFVLGPRVSRHIAGAALVAFQLMLIASGNLSFLNWLTLVPILACFDDSLFAKLVPMPARGEERPTLAHRIAAGALCALVAALSVAPVTNLLSDQQLMNTAHEPLELVNSYGAFGSVGQVRNEIVFEGSTDGVEWREYQFKCKPGDPRRRPCWISPYHLRLDWQIWFAAMGRPPDEPWTVHLVWKLLHADKGALGLLDGDPFDGARPRLVRARLYRYDFAPLGDRAWWKRELVDEWLPALDEDDERLLEFLGLYGWL